LKTVQPKRARVSDRLFDYLSRLDTWEELSWQKIRIPIIGTFLFIQLSVFYFYLFLPNQVCAKIVEPFQKIYVFFDLYQGYGVFAPNPATNNSHITATVMYEDGSIRIYPLMRIERVSLLEKLIRERHRKFLEDNIPQPANIRLLDDVARFVARQCNDVKPTENGKPALKPKIVTLIYFWSEIPPIASNKPNARQFNKRILCTYPVHPEDLQ
jgi:hypothetical protein